MCIVTPSLRPDGGTVQFHSRPGGGIHLFGSHPAKYINIHHFTVITMGMRNRYEKLKQKLLDDSSICSVNRKWFAQYFIWHEKKLKRLNNLRELDEACCKTLYHYVIMLRNVNAWFGNKPFDELTKSDIQRVYDDLEDGIILNSFGRPFEDRASYYAKVFKSKFFKLIGKYDLALDVIEYSHPASSRGTVRFVRQADFVKLASVTNKISHKVMLWLAWDIGENVGKTLLNLKYRDCVRQENPHTGAPEYLINLRKENLKRTRTERREPTNHDETTQLLDMYFQAGKREFIADEGGSEFQRIYDEKGVRRKISGRWIIRPYEPEDKVFDFQYRQAEKIMARAAELSGVKCEPDGQKPTLKDLRSSMACFLLKEGWSIDEIKARMGHRPSSAVIDRYATYMAMDRRESKKKLQERSVNSLRQELEMVKRRERLHAVKLSQQKQQLDMLSARYNVMESVAEALSTELKRPAVLKRCAKKMGRSGQVEGFMESCSEGP